MKKIIAQVAFGLLCLAPLAGEDYPIELMLRDMGYTEAYITVKTANEVRKSNEDAKVYYATKKLDKPFYEKKEEFSKPLGFTKKEILKLRTSEGTESPDMIPALLRYHKENPKSDKITRKLALTTYSVGQYKESLYWYTLTYQRNRKDLESLWNMAAIAEAIGEKDCARVYLKEYERVDSHSAWGRMAREILNSSYSYGNMTESFEDKMARFMDSSEKNEKTNRNGGMVKTSDTKGSEGMIVVSGERYNTETFVASYKPKKNFDESATKDGDTLKGKSQPKEDNKKRDGAKTSLENARITVKAKTSKAKSELGDAEPYVLAEPLFNPSLTVKTNSPEKTTVKPEVKKQKNTPPKPYDEEASVKVVAAPLGN